MKNVFVVSGMSGSGVSTIMGIMEDLGAYCVERIPVEIIPALVRVLNQNKMESIAISTPLFEVNAMVKKLEKNNIEPIVVLSDASNETILKRYKLTRHLHPKIINGAFSFLEDAIEDDRRTFLGLPEFKNQIIIDTENYNQNDLKAILKQKLDYKEKSMTLIIQVFGYKLDLPRSADIVVDTRCLPNPYWVPELREKTGDDKEVYDYVINSEKAKEFLPKLTEYLDYMLQQYLKEGRTHTVIAVGCTGGQHRSLSVARYLEERYKDKYEVILKRTQ